MKSGTESAITIIRSYLGGEFPGCRVRGTEMPGSRDLYFALREGDEEWHLRVSYEAATETYNLRHDLVRHRVAEAMRRSPKGQRTLVTTTGVQYQSLAVV